MLSNEQICTLVVEALDEGKGKNVLEIDVRAKTSITDFMVIAFATFARHVKALANAVLEKVKEKGCKPLGSEGLANGEWALIDLGEVVVHVMQEETREFYDLGRLWQGAEQSRSEQGL